MTRRKIFEYHPLRNRGEEERVEERIGLEVRLENLGNRSATCNLLFSLFFYIISRNIPSRSHVIMEIPFQKFRVTCI